MYLFPDVAQSLWNPKERFSAGSVWGSVMGRWKDLSGKHIAPQPSDNISYANAIVRDTLSWIFLTSSSGSSPFLKMNLWTSFQLNCFEIHFLSQLHTIGLPIPIRRKSRELRSQTVVLNLDGTAHSECPHELPWKGPRTFLSFICFHATELFWFLRSSNILHLLVHVSSSCKS